MDNLEDDNPGMSIEDWVFSSTPIVVNHDHDSQYAMMDGLESTNILEPSIQSASLNNNLDMEMVSNIQPLSPTNIIEGDRTKQLSSLGISSDFHNIKLDSETVKEPKKRLSRSALRTKRILEAKARGEPVLTRNERRLLRATKCPVPAKTPDKASSFESLESGSWQTESCKTHDMPLLKPQQLTSLGCLEGFHGEKQNNDSVKAENKPKNKISRSALRTKRILEAKARGEPVLTRNERRLLRAVKCLVPEKTPDKANFERLESGSWQTESCKTHDMPLLKPQQLTSFGYLEGFHGVKQNNDSVIAENKPKNKISRSALRTKRILEAKARGEPVLTRNERRLLRAAKNPNSANIPDKASSFESLGYGSWQAEDDQPNSMLPSKQQLTSLYRPNRFHDPFHDHPNNYDPFLEDVGNYLNVSDKESDFQNVSDLNKAQNSLKPFASDIEIKSGASFYQGLILYLPPFEQLSDPYTGPSALETLNASFEFSFKTPVKIDIKPRQYQPSVSEATVYFKDHFVASGSGTVPHVEASVRALELLSETCYTIQAKEDYYHNCRLVDAENVKTLNLDEWIALSEKYPKIVEVTKSSHIQKTFAVFLHSHTSTGVYEDIVCCNLTQQEVKHIQSVVEFFSLTLLPCSVSTKLSKKHTPCVVTIQRYTSARKLLDILVNCGGENDKFKLYLPGTIKDFYKLKLNYWDPNLENKSDDNIF